MEHPSSIISRRDKPEPKECQCGKTVPVIKTAMGWYAPSQCKDCSQKETARQEQEEKMKTQKRITARIGLPPRFQKAYFGTFKKELQPVAFEVAQNFAGLYPPLPDAPKGLYLYGQAGSGKTHLAAAIANMIGYHEGMDVRFVTAPELLIDIKKTFNNPQIDDQMFDRLSKAKLLIVDDIGSEKPTEWVQETLFVLIDRRYTHFLPTIFTSNFSLDQLKERLGYKISSRIAEMSKVVEMKPVDYRIRKNK